MLTMVPRKGQSARGVSHWLDTSIQRRTGGMLSRELSPDNNRNTSVQGFSAYRHRAGHRQRLKPRPRTCYPLGLQSPVKPLLLLRPFAHKIKSAKHIYDGFLRMCKKILLT